MMFDVDGNSRIDFNEFNTLMNYVNSMKSNYINTAAANGGAGVTTRDIDSMLNNSHSAFMVNGGGQDMMTRGILPTINPASSGFFTLGNALKIAIIVGLLHTLYQHNKLPFITNNHVAGANNNTAAPMYQPARAGMPGQMPNNMAGGGAGPYGFPAYNTGYGQPIMMTPGMGGAGTQPQQQGLFGGAGGKSGGGGILGRIFSSFGNSNKSQY